MRFSLKSLKSFGRMEGVILVDQPKPQTLCSNAAND